MAVLPTQGVKPTILEAYSVTKSRRDTSGTLRLWRVPEIAVHRGEFVALLGEQRSDVDLILSMSAGLTELSGGVLRIAGKDMHRLSRSQRAALRSTHVGLLFREPHLLPDQTILQNVAFPLMRVGVSRRDAEARARALLERVGLADDIERCPSELPESAHQRGALARALANNPTVLLADEPTENMDDSEATDFLQTLQRICAEDGLALLLGTVQEHLAHHASRTIVVPAFSGAPERWTKEELGSQELLADVYDHDIWPLVKPVAPLLELVLKPLLYVSAVALLIIFLTFFGLAMARIGQSGQPGNWGDGLSMAVSQSSEYLRNLLTGNLGTYQYETRLIYWSTERTHTIADAVASGAPKSLVLLLLSTILAAVLGVTLGLVAATVRHHKTALLFLLLSIAGVSTPSFFLALLLQIAEIQFYRTTGIALVPVGGFGWDRHLILPALVLAARPIAQIARISAVALGEVLDADYVRTAHAKGLAPRIVLTRHALANAAVPILTCIGASLRFSLSSLPVVETLFQWPGIGETLLMAIRNQYPDLVATLTLILGVLFVAVQVALDNLYRWIDPRLREAKTGLAVQRNWVALVASGWSSLLDAPSQWWSWLSVRLNALRDGNARFSGEEVEQASDDQRRRDAHIRRERTRAWVQSTAGSVPFAAGGLILVLLLAAVVFGQKFAPHSPFSPVTRLTINGLDTYAPFPPSGRFPFGTDALGRDILSMLLFGARRTLALAFFAVVTRLLVGTILGALSGWFSGSLLDRSLSALNQVIAAFPSLLLAMVLIYALGIQEGLWVFALALCVVGWGEASQFVRGQVMRIREQDYIEGAAATGLSDMQLLARHVLPNVVPSLVVLAFLEMGGVLMLLGELGFIGLFIGGGWATRTTLDVSVTYFDVPEWGVMLSNTWRSFRSQPWMTFYPALAFTLSIVGFNLFGEGLRRLTERLTLSMHKIVNRWTIVAALALGLLMVATAEGTGSWTQFTAPAALFSPERAMLDIRALASPEMGGRAVGSESLEKAAGYIKDQFAALGLQPASADDNGLLTYYARREIRLRALGGQPVLRIRDGAGGPLVPLAYRQDYVEVPSGAGRIDSRNSEIVALGIDPGALNWPEGMDAQPSDLYGKTILVTQYLPTAIRTLGLEGAVLLAAPESEYLTHRQLVHKPDSSDSYWFRNVPYVYLSSDVADAVLRRAGHSLAELRERQESLGVNGGFLWRTGAYADVMMTVRETESTYPPYVQAILPGQDEELDNELIIVLASYDGQGPDYDGTAYPGANQNASGVAVMLEIARLLTEQDYQPRRTILFVAWCGAEVHEPPDFAEMLQARLGFVESYRVAGVLELTGVGGGSRPRLVLQRGTSGRLTETVQQAARRAKVESTTSGTSMYGVFSGLYPTVDRRIPYVAMSWEGSHLLARTPADTVDSLQPARLSDAGRVAALAVMYLGHERTY